MLNLPHRHVVFTLPHQLNYLITKINFFFSIHSCRLPLSFKGLDELQIYLQPGIISVLHTLANKRPHFHTHMILSWEDKQSRTVEQIKGIYVNYDY